MVGCEIDGVQGYCAAPLLRITGLIRLTLLQIRVAWTDKRTFGCLLSSWVSVFMYRRPLLCVMVEVFRCLQDLPEEGAAAVTRPVRNELLCLALLGPLAITDLRAPASTQLFGTDASRHRAGIVQAEVGPEVSLELWRQGEHGGWHTRLESEIERYLAEVSPGDTGAAPCLCAVPAPLTEASCTIASRSSKGGERGVEPTRPPGFASIRDSTSK